MRHSKMSAMSDNVFDIVSKNFVTAVPALQFFDDSDAVEVPKPVVSRLPSAPVHRPHTSRSAQPSRPPSSQATPPPRPATSRATPSTPPATTISTPRGICYTINDDGQRLCKTEHNMSDLELDRTARCVRSSIINPNHAHCMLYRGRFNDKVTSVEDAMLLNMNKRLKIRMGLKKSRLQDISTAFNLHQKQLTETLVATLGTVPQLYSTNIEPNIAIVVIIIAMHWAEQEDMHVKKLSVVCLNDTNMPSFRIDKEVHLSHLRHQKWRLYEMCKLVSLFGAMLKAAEDTPGDMTRSAMRVLSMFRILIEDHSTLTPIVLKSIVAQLTPADLQCPRVLLNVVHKRLTTWRRDDEPAIIRSPLVKAQTY
ncbi:hypothetical protein DYB25_000775 [Aphanomyces astaci]|uniref:Uncharacterized protein n=2 Tax=Aphanomyces astaci TaxID=112090 RepID=A0A397B592_APHAT|nr:hypothetical protein DYB25_000775 [Aphanomyces astaci]RHZ22325.1 hypothetical protein DYB31_001916 [Aphanomyces astaci]RHZ23325.1 hypothetical protein DYB26_001329 [Aphanomyces astaci]